MSWTLICARNKSIGGYAAYDLTFPSYYHLGSAVNFKVTANVIGGNPNPTFCYMGFYFAQVNNSWINTDDAPLNTPTAGPATTYAPGSTITTYGDWQFLGSDPEIYEPLRRTLTGTPTQYTFTVPGNNTSGTPGTGGAVLANNGGPGFNGVYTNANGSTVNCHWMTKWVPEGGADLAGEVVSPNTLPLLPNCQATLVVKLSALGLAGDICQSQITDLQMQFSGGPWIELDLSSGYVGFNEGDFPEAFSPQVPLSTDPASAAPAPFINASNLYLIGSAPPPPPSNPMTPSGARIPLPKPHYAENKRLLFYPWDKGE